MWCRNRILLGSWSLSAQLLLQDFTLTSVQFSLAAQPINEWCLWWHDPLPLTTNPYLTNNYFIYLVDKMEHDGAILFILLFFTLNIDAVLQYNTWQRFQNSWHTFTDLSFLHSRLCLSFTQITSYFKMIYDLCPHNYCTHTVRMDFTVNFRNGNVHRFWIFHYGRWHF